MEGKLRSIWRMGAILHGLNMRQIYVSKLSNAGAVNKALNFPKSTITRIDTRKKAIIFVLIREKRYFCAK
jgi:hypothetical protein